MLWVPLFVACVFLLHPILGLIALGGALGLVLFGVLHNLATRSQLQEAGQLSRGLSSVIERSMRHGQTLQAMGMMEHFKRRWIRERGRLIRLQATAADRSGIFAGVTKSLRILLQTALLGAGALLAINDEVSACVIVAASMLMSRALAPVEATIGGWRQCLAAHGPLSRTCGLKGLLREAFDAFLAVLDRATLADLVAEPRWVTQVVALHPRSTRHDLRKAVS
jgi:ABC-type protease/lipase transport system fused ATPase/permease subunit